MEISSQMCGSELQANPEKKAIGQDRPGRILLVDDDLVAIEPLHIQLQLEGFEVLLTETGRQGLDLARSWHPDVIVLDLCLPDVDGLEICRALMANPTTADIPIIILSGMEGADLLRRCRAAGGMYYVAKPYDPNVLLLLISQAAADHRLWHDTSLQNPE